MDKVLAGYRERIEEVMVNKRPFKYHDNLYPWPFVNGRVTKSSYDLAFEVPYGYSAGDLESQVDALSAACGAIVEIKNRAGVVVVSVYPQDFPAVIKYRPEMLKETSGRTVLLGYDRHDTAVTHNFRVPHLLIAGMSGYGKTDLIRWILFQLINRFTPAELEIQIIDGKGFSFLPFRNVPHITRIARSLPAAVEVLAEAHQAMLERSEEVWESGNRYDAKQFKWKIVLIDEAAQIAPALQRDKDTKQLAGIADQLAAAISCVGREAQVGLIYCTQRPDSTVINGQVKANMDAAICFRTKTGTNSEIVIDRRGAELLPADRPGRAIYSATTDTILQVPYVGDDEAWERVLSGVIRGDKKRTNKAKDNETPDTHTDGFNDPSGDILS